MGQIFITELKIEKVRHLENISIPLSGDKIKHLILTGKNGSGKTSVIEALEGYLNHVMTDQFFDVKIDWLHNAEQQRELAIQNGEDEEDILKLENDVCKNIEKLQKSRNGLDIQFNVKTGNLIALIEKYHYILAYYSADRIFQAEQPKHVEKVQFKDNYGLTEFPRNEFVKYLLDLKMTEALARNSHKIEKAEEINAWFVNLENLLKEIFADKTVKLEFENYDFISGYCHS